MPKVASSKKIVEYQRDIETDGFGMPFAKSIKRGQGIASLATGKGGVKKGETKNWSEVDCHG